MTNRQEVEWISPFDLLLEDDAGAGVDTTPDRAGSTADISDRDTVESAPDSREPDKPNLDTDDAHRRGPSALSQDGATSPKSATRVGLGHHPDGQRNDAFKLPSLTSVLEQFADTGIGVDTLVQQAIDYGWPASEQDTASADGADLGILDPLDEVETPTPFVRTDLGMEEPTLDHADDVDPSQDPEAYDF